MNEIYYSCILNEHNKEVLIRYDIEGISGDGVLPFDRCTRYYTVMRKPVWERADIAEENDYVSYNKEF